MAGGNHTHRRAATGAVARFAMPVQQTLGVGEQAGLDGAQQHAGLAQAHAACVECGFQFVDTRVIVQRQQEMRAFVGHAEQGGRQMTEQARALVGTTDSIIVAVVCHLGAAG